MKKLTPSKFISLFMALLLVFSLAAVTALADEADPSSSESSSSESSEKSTPSPAPSAAPEAPTLAVPDASTDFYIYDEGNLLSAETKAAILEKNKTLNEKYGIQVVVMIMKDAQGTSLRNYGPEVFKKWKIGGDSENGVLLTIDMAGDTYYAMVGEGISKAFEENHLQTLLNSYLETDFADQKYDSGIKKFFDATVAQIETYVASLNDTKTNKTGGGILGGIGIFLLIVVIVVAVLIAVVYVHGQMVRKKRQAARAARRRVSSGSDEAAPRSTGSGRLPDDLTSYHSSSSSKYDFDEFKPRK